MAGVKFSSLFSRSRNLVGIDIGYDTIKGVEMVEEGGRYRITPYAIVPVEAGTDPQDRRGATLSAIRHLVRSNKFTTKRVATAVSGENVIVRILRLPIFETSDESLEFAVRGEARDFIPFDMEDVIFDFQKLGEVEHEESRVAEVLIVAVRKDVIEERLKLLEEAGLEPAVIDVGSFALCNAISECGGTESGEAVALVNIGAEITSVAILKDGVTRFTRDLSIGGRNITEVIGNELEIDPSEAEQLKRKFGIIIRAEPSAQDMKISHSQQPEGDEDLYGGGSLYGDESDLTESLYGESESSAPDDLESLYETYSGETPTEPKGTPAPKEGEGEGDILSEISKTIDELTPQVDEAQLEYGPEGQRISEICEHFIGEITGEVKRSLLYYENQLGGEVVSRIILSGGTSKMRNIEKYFEQNLDVKCQRIEPLSKVDADLSREQAEDLMPLIGVGIGLSLRSFFDKQ